MFREEIPYIEENLNPCPDFRRSNWNIAFGLQAIDGKVPSDYLVRLSKKQIAGEITFEELELRLNLHYGKALVPRGTMMVEEVKTSYSIDMKEEDSTEADYSSTRIAEILATESFALNPGTLLGYHEQIFSGIEAFHYPVGQIRKVNISKAEKVLNGDSVLYSNFGVIRQTLNWDFDQEKGYDYQCLERSEKAHCVMKFISSVWQIHPFRDGNTRTIATFAIKYLRYLGFEVDNKPFEHHSVFFRDALALANYHKEGKTEKYLTMFTENLLLGGKHELVIEVK